MTDQLEEAFGMKVRRKEIEIDSEVLFRRKPSNVTSCVTRVD